MTVGSIAIRPMAETDIEPAADLLLRHEFGDRLAFFRWAIILNSRLTCALAIAACRFDISAGCLFASADLPA